MEGVHCNSLSPCSHLPHRHTQTASPPNPGRSHLEIPNPANVKDHQDFAVRKSASQLLHHVTARKVVETGFRMLTTEIGVADSMPHINHDSNAAKHRRRPLDPHDLPILEAALCRVLSEKRNVGTINHNTVRLSGSGKPLGKLQPM